MNEEIINECSVVTIEGEQFFTAKWVLEQMSAQNSSIGRANRIAAVAVVISVLSLISSIILSIALG